MTATPNPLGQGSLKMVDPLTARVTGAFGNTGATPAKPAPSPARASYVQSQMPAAPANPTQNPNFPTQTGAFDNAPAGTPVSTTPATKPDPTSGYRSAFDEYISSLKPSAEETSARENLNNITLQSKKDYEKALQTGDTQGFATGEAARVNRNNSFATEAAANVLDSYTNNRNAMTEAQKARMDFEKTLLPKDDPYTLSEGETRYDAKGNVIASVAKTPAAQPGFTLSPGERRYDSDGKLLASGGPKPLSQTQEAAGIAANEKATVAQQSAAQTIGLVNELLSGDTGAITGAGQNPLNFVGLTNAKALNQYDQLQGLLKLGIRGLLKGQGAVSDYEGKVLGQAASALGRNLSNADFKSALTKIRGVLKTNNGESTEVIVHDANGNAVGKGILNGKDIYEAVLDGNTIEYI